MGRAGRCMPNPRASFLFQTRSPAATVSGRQLVPPPAVEGAINAFFFYLLPSGRGGVSACRIPPVPGVSFEANAAIDEADVHIGVRIIYWLNPPVSSSSYPNLVFPLSPAKPSVERVQTEWARLGVRECSVVRGILSAPDRWGWSDASSSSSSPSCAVRPPESQVTFLLLVLVLARDMAGRIVVADCVCMFDRR